MATPDKIITPRLVNDTVAIPRLFFRDNSPLVKRTNFIYHRISGSKDCHYNAAWD